MTEKHPDSKIIDQLGGTAVTARIFDIAMPSVTKWRWEGIPKARLMYLKVARPDLFQAAPQAQSVEVGSE